ncbi:MAG: bifunctional diaminohydroxyphosphoribosylaminopyrimidine deaminase/5-amino-6-(5-phosphoribosylamino)uracil reductase RibD [Trueperaceae bacterium]|nr:bifunctional diaminohydroxyphosphoribosylaminopyrimidine deaminase/5-amino-6-(5-phosphoribosylamino)uracil reductase RibD [Trueperaceae bacterium]
MNRRARVAPATVVTYEPETDRPRSGHARFMTTALELAERGRGTTSPNPLVGCVLVHPAHPGSDHGAIVGRGYHAEAGGPHAEVVALEAADGFTEGATAYVTLEPCNHHGRTPPCTEALIEAGVARVVVATLDPDPRVRGRGVARLREAGVQVEVGVLADLAEAQNEPYLTAQREGRPWVLYKTATSLDGKTAATSGDARWVTGPAARDRVHALRGRVDAVAVGIATVLQDDPRLTTRGGHGRTPRKVVFDGAARTPVDAALFQPDDANVPADVTIFVGTDAPAERVAALRAAGADVVAPGGAARPRVAAALASLHEREVRSLLLEGGGTLAAAFLAANAIDRVAWFLAPTLVGGDAPTALAGAGAPRMADATALADVTYEAVGDDLLVEGRVVRPGPPDAADDASAPTPAPRPGDAT